MGIPNDTPLKRRPTHPGEILREDFMPDYGLTVSGLAKSLGVSRQTVNELVRERRSLFPELALRPSGLFGNSPEFWLNLQRAVDLWDARVALQDAMRRIKQLRVAWQASAADARVAADRLSRRTPRRIGATGEALSCSPPH